MFTLSLPRAALVAALTLAAGPALRAADPAGPKVGDTAKEFELPALGGAAGEKVKLSTLPGKGPVVLVVLRGYPGYQCPLCTRQFAEFLAKADQFKAAGARVVFVYPGPADKVDRQGRRVLPGQGLPGPLHRPARPGLRVHERLRPALGRQERDGLPGHARPGRRAEGHVRQGEQDPRRPHVGRGRTQGGRREVKPAKGGAPAPVSCGVATPGAALA